MASFVFSVWGWYVFREGRKRDHMLMVMIGVALMTYTYFTKGPWLDWGIGSALALWAYQIR